jgi:hypothetical protein
MMTCREFPALPACVIVAIRRRFMAVLEHTAADIRASSLCEPAKREAMAFLREHLQREMAALLRECDATVAQHQAAEALRDCEPLTASVH